MSARGELRALEPVTNGAENGLATNVPYVVRVDIEGSVPLLMHRYNPEAVEQKANAKKGSKEKKTDDLESMVYRDTSGYLCIPGEYLRQSIIDGGRYRQDPRSPRKSCVDLFKAGITVLTELAPITDEDNPKGTKKWSYVDQRRVVIQRGSAVTRNRPAFNKGWRASFEVQVNLPEYIDQAMLNEAVQMSGRVCGTADFRPTYGRFQVTHFEVTSERP